MSRTGDELKLLFVCSRNQWRSPTAEHLCNGFRNYVARSAGTAKSARVRITEGHIGWADIIFAMEKKHVQSLRRRFDQRLDGKTLICLHIADDYRFMDPKLIVLLKSKLRDYISVPD